VVSPLPYAYWPGAYSDRRQRGRRQPPGPPPSSADL